MIHSPKLIDVGSAERCLEHTQNIIVHYCMSHDQIGCSECMSKYHSACAVVSIDNIAKGAKDSVEYKSMIKELSEVKHLAEENEKQALDYKSKSDKCLSNTMLDVRTFRNDINSHLEQMEKEIANQAKLANIECKMAMDRVISESKKVQKQVKNCLKEFKDLETKATRLFIKMNRTKADILKFRHDTERDRPVHAQSFSFEPNTSLEDIFRTSNNLGKLKFSENDKKQFLDTSPKGVDTVVVKEKQPNLCKISQEIQKELRLESQDNKPVTDCNLIKQDCIEKENNACDDLSSNATNGVDSKSEANPDEYEDNGIQDLRICAGGKLNVKLLSDTEDCDISGIDMISDDELVLADYNNRSVKILDMLQNKITHEMKLDYHPYDLTVPCENTIAVTLTNTIQVITKSHLLRLKDSINVDGECYGITSSRTKYFVSFIKPVAKVAILNHQGDVLQTFCSDPSRRLVIKRPRYLDISSDEKFIYITDFGKDCIIKLNADGELLNTYSDATILNGPYGLHVDESGSVFVCNYGNDNIYEFSADLSKHRLVLSKSEGVESPQAIYICNKKKKLLIASTDSADCNEIQIFGHSE